MVLTVIVYSVYKLSLCTLHKILDIFSFQLTSDLWWGNIRLADGAAYSLSTVIEGIYDFTIRHGVWSNSHSFKKCFYQLKCISVYYCACSFFFTFLEKELCRHGVQNWRNCKQRWNWKMWFNINNISATTYWNFWLNWFLRFRGTQRDKISETWYQAQLKIIQLTSVSFFIHACCRSLALFF